MKHLPLVFLVFLFQILSKYVRNIRPKEVMYMINVVLLQARGQQAYSGKLAPALWGFLRQKKKKKEGKGFVFSIYNA